MLPSSFSAVPSSLSSSPIGKLLWEVGKALGKAVVAGIGLELARAATRQVKKVVGPTDAVETSTDTDDDDRPTAQGRRAATAKEVERIRRENAALREELVALKRELGRPSADDDAG